MNRLLSLLLISLSIISIQAATLNKDDRYQIIKLSTPTIVIGKDTLKVGDKFKGSSKIKWVTKKHYMIVKDLNTFKHLRFSRTVLKQKRNVSSIFDFLFQTNKASTRGIESDIDLERSPNASNYPERRIALVLGNSIYDNIPTLANAQKDAEDISETLLDLGFDVIHTYECNYTDMSTAVNRFATLAKDYQVAFFYYAGHGIQEDDINYLIPVDNMLERRDDLRYCLSCNDIVDRVENSGCPSKIFFFDACRNRKSAWSRSALNGLSSMEGSVGTVIAFATQSGKVATDGERGDNSPFAKMLMKNMRTPNISFSEMMTSVVRDTYFATNKKQYPVQVGNLIENFRFNPQKNNSDANPPNYNSTQNETSTSILEQANKAYDDGSYQKAMQLLLRIPDNPKAQNLIGIMYHEGHGVTKNYMEATKWYRKAANQGYARAQFSIGSMYYFGEGVTKNYTEAVNWFRKAADKGVAEAKCLIGIMYYNGEGVTKDYTEALKWFHKAAEQEIAIAQLYIGVMYSNGQGVTQDYAKAMKWYRKAAEQGDDDAQYRIGVLYSNGQGVTQDYAEAMKWFSKAANQGYAKAQYKIGLMYFHGDGVTKNYAEAMSLFSKAAEQGHTAAQYHIGLMYYFGEGATKNYTEAMKWFHKAADQGYAAAQNTIGVMYSNGEGVIQDHAEALKWYRKAAEQGDAKAQINIGGMYHDGDGVTTDYVEAMKWYRKAANQGDANAQYNIGLMYYYGNGVAKDYAEAKKWLKKAAEQGDEEAKKFLADNKF